MKVCDHGCGNKTTEPFCRHCGDRLGPKGAEKMVPEAENCHHEEIKLLPASVARLACWPVPSGGGANLQADYVATCKSCGAQWLYEGIETGLDDDIQKALELRDALKSCGLVSTTEVEQAVRTERERILRVVLDRATSYQCRAAVALDKATTTLGEGRMASSSRHAGLADRRSAICAALRLVAEEASHAD